MNLVGCKSPHHQLPGRVVSISDAGGGIPITLIGGTREWTAAVATPRNETPQTPVRVLGRVAEQPSPEYCSISSLRSDFPLVNGTDRPKRGHVRADRQLAVEMSRLHQNPLSRLQEISIRRARQRREGALYRVGLGMNGLLCNRDRAMTSGPVQLRTPPSVPRSPETSRSPWPTVGRTGPQVMSPTTGFVRKPARSGFITVLGLVRISPSNGGLPRHASWF